MDGLLGVGVGGGGGGQRVCWPPYQIIGGPPPPLLPTPMHTNVSGVRCAHTCDSTAGSRKIPFIKPVCRSTVPVDQTTVFENFRKYYENPVKSVPISLFRHAPV